VRVRCLFVRRLFVCKSRILRFEIQAHRGLLFMKAVPRSTQIKYTESESDQKVMRWPSCVPANYTSLISFHRNVRVSDYYHCVMGRREQIILANYCVPS